MSCEPIWTEYLSILHKLIDWTEQDEFKNGFMNDLKTKKCSESELLLGFTDRKSNRFEKSQGRGNGFYFHNYGVNYITNSTF